MNAERRIARIFLGVRCGEHIASAMHRAAAEGCDFLCFNDRLISATDGRCAWEDAPVIRERYLRGDMDAIGQARDDRWETHRDKVP